MADKIQISINKTTAEMRIPLGYTSARQYDTISPTAQFIRINRAELFGVGTEPIFDKLLRLHYSEAYQTMLASESVLRRDWNLPEEDDAWANL